MTPQVDLSRRSLLVAASYVVLRRGDEVLLQRRQNTGYMDGFWANLAGHVDPYESVLDAAVREAREEAGVEIRVEDLRPLTTLHRVQVGGPPVEQRCDFFFEVRRWTGEPTVLEPAKCAALEWFRLGALPEDVVPYERLVLQGLHRGDLQPIVSLRRAC